MSGNIELIPQFKPEKLLNQDQGGRRIVLLGTIDSQPSILILERTAFPNSMTYLATLPSGLNHIESLGHNDIYSWFLASTSTASASLTHPDVKVNIIHPCTGVHIKKYSPQGFRMVKETPEIYRSSVQPFMQKMREQGRLNWVWNILDGKAEQEDVILRVSHEEDGFLLVPDLNWDRKTISSLHLLALVQRRDIWSLRDLKKRHIPWLELMRQQVIDATVKLYPDLEGDQLKLYAHYQPTYYHFHVHIVHVGLEAGVTQATGKAFGLDNIISQLQSMAGGEDAGMADVDLTYSMGEASELWWEVFQPRKASK